MIFRPNTLFFNVSPNRFLKQIFLPVGAEKTTKPIRMISIKRSTSKSVEINQHKKQTQFERPVSIKRLIESDIGSLDDEFKKLKEVDERFHVLKWAQILLQAQIRFPIWRGAN